MKLENINIYNLDISKIKDIIEKVSLNYVFNVYIKDVVNEDIKKDVQKAIDDYCKVLIRESKIKKIFNESNLIDNIVNLDIDIKFTPENTN